MDNNESSVILEKNNENNEITENNSETLDNKNITDVDVDDNKKIGNEDVDKLMPLNDELFLYNENNVKNDDEENKNDNNEDENRNYVTTSEENSFTSISENSFQMLKNEIKFKHKINVISEESENEEDENKKKNDGKNSKDVTSNNLSSENVENSNTKINEENNSKNFENDDDNENNNNVYKDTEDENNESNMKLVQSPVNSIIKHDYSNESLTFIKADNKYLNDTENFNFETASIADNKSIISSYSLNKDNDDNHSIKTNNEAILLQSVNFSRSKVNYSYNNDFDYLTNFKKAENYLKSYKDESDDDTSKKFLLFKPFYTIANGVISKQLNDNEQISGSSFYTSHAGYINVIKKKVTLDYIWNNSLPQIYFLMFLIHKDPELAYVFLFYVDADNFRINSPFTTSVVRKQQALKIFDSYFVSLSDTFIDWKYFLSKIPVNSLFKRLKNQLDTGTSIMFDDYLFFAMLIMEKVFYGEEIISNENEFKKDKEKKNKFSATNNLTIDSFENSVFYQEMINDSVFYSYTASTVNMKRAAERILNMPITYFNSISVVKKISKYLVRIGVDKHIVSESKLMQQIKFKGKEGSIKQMIKHPRTQSDMLSVFGKSDSGNSNKLSRTFSTKSNRSSKSRRGSICEHDNQDAKSEIIQMQTNYNYQPEEELTVNHVFVKYTDKKFTMCEYCLDDKQISKKDLKSLYQCETCNMIVHKCCRKLVTFDCVDNKKSIYDQYEGDNEEEIITKLKERIAAINNEIKLEESIQAGAKRVIELSSNNSSSQTSNSLLEQSIKKVEVLNSELNNNKVYLEKLEAKIKEKQEQIEKDKLEDSLSKEISVKYSKDEEVIETKIKIQENHTTSEVIIILLNKLELSGLYNDYTLNYLSKDNNLIELMYSESPLKNVDYEKVQFILKNINKGNKRDSKDSYNFEKRLNVANEIHVTEKNYLQKLNQIKTFFIEPMEKSKIFSQESIDKIFVNILDILELHKNMVKSLKELWKNLDDIIELEENLIKIYIDMLPKLSPEYSKYCSNRAIGDEYLLDLYNEDPKTKKFISECENNNKVALDKLTLKDLLIEPMHRITRYSILFKRLSGYINYPPHTINSFLLKLDEETKKINKAVGEMDSVQKVIKMEKNLDWNNAFYKFNIVCDQRSLLNTQEFHLIDKYGHNNKVTAYTFNDLILIIKMRKNIPVLCIPPITYESCNFIDCFETAESDLDNIIKIIHNQHNVYLLRANSRADKMNWLQEVGLIKISFCLSLYMSKNQPTILLNNCAGDISISDSSFDISSVTSTSKRSFFSSLFDKSSGRKFSNTSARKLSAASLDSSGKQKSMFLGRRFSISSKRNDSMKSTNEDIMINEYEEDSTNELDNDNDKGNTQE